MKNVIQELFNLKDERIIFDDNVENIFEIKNKNKEKIKIIKGKLSYIPDKCYYCNSIKLIKNGFDIIKIQISKVASTKTYLQLIKQKIICKECNKGFTVKCKDHKKYSRTSVNLLTDIDYNLANTTHSMVSIANQNNTSTSKIKREIERLVKEIKINKKVLPEVLCIDEVNGVKTQYGKYNCVLVDGENKKLKDILITRRQNKLENYFNEYTKEAKNNVKYFVTDMYDTYIRLSKKHFTNAKIIIDKFHITKNILSAIDDIRIKYMNSLNRKSYEYRLLKKHNKKLKKRFNDISINYKKYRYNPELKSEYEILEKILSFSNDLTKAYIYLQEFFTAFDKKDVDKFRKLLNDKDILSIKNDKWITCIKTLKKYKTYIENSIIYKYTNGITEAINKKLKDIKRQAYGFRNYFNFRARALINFNLIQKE